MLGILAHRGLPVLWLTESNHGTASVRAISISYVDVMPSLPSAPAFAPGGTWLDGGLFRPEIVTRKGAGRQAEFGARHALGRLIRLSEDR